MGTLERLRVEDLEPQLRAAIATALATGLGGGDIPFLDLAANQTAMSEKLKEAVTPVFAQWGLVVPSFFVESLSLPEEVQSTRQVSSMRLIGDLIATPNSRAPGDRDRSGSAGRDGGAGRRAAAGMEIGQTMAASLAGGEAEPALRHRKIRLRSSSDFTSC